MTRTSDFRTMDLEVETHTSGIDEHGYPFYVWRESADNRYGLSRPRYCCITASGPELHFTFFNPSEDVKLTAAWKAGAAVAASFFVLFIVTMITDSYLDAPMPYSRDPAPGMVLIATFGSAGIFGGLVFYVWDCVATMLRWIRNRFADDGRVTQIPWAHLDSFQVVTPEEAGVEREREKRGSGGHGLLATFGNESTAIPLTANVWNHQSIAGKHRDLTVLFIDRRDAFLAAFKKKQRPDGSPPSGNGESGPSLKL